MTNQTSNSSSFSNSTQDITETPKAGTFNGSQFWLLGGLLLLSVLYLFARRRQKASQSSNSEEEIYEIDETMISAVPLTEQVADITLETIKKLPTKESIWTVGVTAKSASVTEENGLRVMEFLSKGQTVSAKFIIALIVKAMVNPTSMIDGTEEDEDDPTSQYQRRPSTLAFMESPLIDATLVQQVSDALVKYDIKVSTYSAVGPEMEEMFKKRRAEMFKQTKESQKQGMSQKQKVDFSPQPQRGCFQCKKDIPGKASQCSACKAIIYCSPACAKKDWSMHKQLCGAFKKNMDHIASWKMHDFPFTFYNQDKHLNNFNLVDLLVQEGLHNVGIYQRLCACYSQTAFGELNGERMAQLEAAEVTDPYEAFEILGLTKEWYPLSKPLENPRKVVSWKTLYEAKGISLDNIAGLVFDHAMTVWHMLNRYVLDSIAVKDGKRTITIHLIGTETEADVLPTFAILLGLLPPKTDLAIHCIGPTMSTRLAQEHRQMFFESKDTGSRLLLTLTPLLYTPECHSGKAIIESFEGNLPFGKGKPDVAIILNGNLLAYETWVHSIKLLVDLKQKVLITEPLEQNVEALARNLPAIGGLLSLEITLNPFRQPVYAFKKDTNLPGFSNAFICGLN